MRRFLPVLALACGPHVGVDDRSSACVDCHARAVSDWSESQHASTHADPVFQVSWRATRDPWCLGCHLAEDGVTCATCHGPEGRTCIDCHEFDLPRDTHAGLASGTLAQSTVSEHARSSASTEACTTCHPPHRPRGGHDMEWVRAAVSLVVRSDGPEIDAAFAVADLGHAFPTGDPFRRLELVVCADLACQRPIARHTLQRRLERTDDGGWQPGLDTRIPPPSDGPHGRLRVRLHAPGARAWRLTYHLTDPAHAADLGDASRYVVATGLVESP